MGLHVFIQTVDIVPQAAADAFGMQFCQNDRVVGARVSELEIDEACIGAGAIVGISIPCCGDDSVALSKCENRSSPIN